nr:MAG TPA: hypothetical protein [Caudoviricetes sp.]
MFFLNDVRETRDWFLSSNWILQKTVARLVLL